MATELETLRAVKQLGQVMPANTNAYVLISKAAKRKVVITSVIVSNVTSSSAKYAIFLDINGTSATDNEAIAHDVTLAAKTYTILEFNTGLPMNHETAGTLTVSSDTANAICFTVNGIEF